MKKSLLAIMISAASLFAADTNLFQIAPTFGKNFSDTSSKMTNSDLLYGVRGAWKNIAGYGVEVGFESSDDIMYRGMDITTSLTRVFGHITFTGEEEYLISPYAFIGAGYESLSQNTEGDPDQTFIDAGIGFSYVLYSFLNLSLETKALYKLDTEDIDYTLGVGFYINFDDSFRINKIGTPFVKKSQGA